MDTLASYFFSGSPCPLDKKIMKIFNNYEKDKSTKSGKTFDKIMCEMVCINFNLDNYVNGKMLSSSQSLTLNCSPYCILDNYINGSCHPCLNSY